MSSLFNLESTTILKAIDNLKEVIEKLPKYQTDVAKAAASAAKDAAKKETEISLIAVGLDPKGPPNPVQAAVDIKLQSFPPSYTTPIVIPPEPCPSGLTLDITDNKCKVMGSVRGGAKKQTRKKRSRRPRRTVKNLRK